MFTINMMSSAHKVKGQGVASAYEEQVRLVTEGLAHKYEVKVNRFNLADITHYHTIDFKHFLTIPFAKQKGVAVGYVHFLPETMDQSLELPESIKKVFYKYMIGFYDRMDYLVTVNPYFIDKLEEYGINRKKIVYIPNFVSEEEFYPYAKSEINQVREKLGILPKDFVVLGVGQVQTRKGVKDFVEIAKQIPDVQFVWAGGFSFGAITDGYKELKKVVENPLQNVRFLGIVEREEMNDLYNMADVMFLPSYNELFPMTILESMNCKVPILLRDLDIYRDILFDFYLKADNNKGFKYMIRKLQSSPLFYEKWAKQSFKGHTYYSKKNVLKKWEHFYDQILKDKKSHSSKEEVYEKKSI